MRKLDSSNINEFRKIGNVGNCYGGVVIMESDGDFYIGVSGYEGDQVQSIPESLYAELMAFQDALDRKETGVGEMAQWGDR